MGTWYKISRRTEETECDECGYPLYIGDRAYMAPDGYVYCSRACQNDAERRRRKDRKNGRRREE